MSVTSRVVARRIGRIAFGVVLLVGAGYIASRSWRHDLFSPDPYRPLPPPAKAATIVVATWLAAFVAGLAAWLIALRARLSDPRTLAAEGLMVPIVGITMMLPITLHMPFVIAMGGVDAFDFWVGASVWITGFAHLVFAGQAALRAHQLVAGRPAWSPRRIYMFTVIASCIPFVVLFAIPPLLVGITALPLVTLLFRMERVVARERDELGAALDLPRAIALGSDP